MRPCAQFEVYASKKDEKWESRIRDDFSLLRAEASLLRRHMYVDWRTPPHEQKFHEPRTTLADLEERKRRRDE